MKNDKKSLIDYTEDGGKNWKEAEVVKVDGGIYGKVTLKDSVSKEIKTVNSEQTKMRVRISN